MNEIIETKNYIQFEKLKQYDDIIHLTTKIPLNFNHNILSNEEIQKNYELIQNELNYKFKKIKRGIQIHRDRVEIVTEENIDNSFDEVDGLITNLRGVGIVTYTADCQSILLYDPNKKVIGNIHSGWKGTLNKIIKNAISLMINGYKCNPKDIMAFICPSILKCCLEVDEEVVDMFKSNFDNIQEYIYIGEVKDNKQKYFIDTVGINIKVMQELGLSKENIICSNICNKCHSKKFHSYRVDKDKSGRNISLICLK